MAEGTGLTVARLRAVRAMLEAEQAWQEQVWALLEAILRLHHISLDAVELCCMPDHVSDTQVWSVGVAPGWVRTPSLQAALEVCNVALDAVLAPTRSLAWSPQAAASVSCFFGTGLYGNGPDAAMPDTSLEEWNAGVDALLAECEALKRASLPEPVQALPWVGASRASGVWRHQTYRPGVTPAVEVPHTPADLIWCEAVWPALVCRCGMYRLVWE